MQRTGIFFGILFFLLTCLYQIYAQDFSWANGITTHTTGTAAASDPYGNCYIIGYFSGTAVFGTVSLTTAGSIDMFVAKYASDGTLLWARRGGGSSDDIGNAICTDTLGNCYVTGKFAGTATFGSSTVTSLGNDEVFLVKYQSNGSVEWAKSGGGTSSDYGNGCTIDAAGCCIVTGSFLGSATFGSVTLTAPNSSTDVFLVRYSPAGELLWATRGGGIWTDLGNAVSADKYGFSYLTGSFENTASFGSLQTTATTLDYPDVFIACYDSQGTPQWLQKIGGTGLEKVTGICAGIPGKVAVTGTFVQPITAGLTQLTSAGGLDIYLCQYDSSGSLTWAQRAGGTDLDASYALCNDQPGNYLLAGHFSLTANFGTIQLTTCEAGYHSDLFVASYFVTGQVRNAISAGGSFEDIARGVASDGMGNAFITGSHQSATFGIFQQIPSYGFMARTGPSPLQALANLTCQHIPGRIRLTWTDNCISEMGFKLERKAGDSLSIAPFQEIASLPPNSTTFDDTLFTTGNTYTYRVRGYIQQAQGPWSNMAVVTPLVGIEEGSIATCVCLYPVFPNPCNPEANIRFTLPSSRQVHLAVYNSLGELVTLLANRGFQAGTYTITFRNSALSGGIYFIELRTEKEVKMQKVLLLH